ncbi:hypothetical protein CQA49_05375 [Helicobacter sp. MIT 00-7814]|uniref:CiaD-like domain-containing protein n=1 Tax=unclassified Helicobacter TaxID=2593540 RepID=UPI000E1EF0CE|nr:MULTISPECIES: hypothetical protein [unclassified Helicobacter]RDU54219.1 hypothetical protein CQA49_05375 [Helicobacter sp. MIT 00-7814]RDU56035.1 hypothetical protein CQA37_03045 [Helicobacter sp. MIT 99-10781]
MELKDIILETISSLESTQSLQESSEISEIKENMPLDSASMLESFEALNKAQNAPQAQKQDFSQNFTQPHIAPFAPNHTLSHTLNHQNASKTPSEFAPSVLSVINEPKRQEALSDEVQFLSLLQERLLVLFEGLNQQNLQSNKQLEMVINFLQYQLSVIERRLEILSQTTQPK